MSRSLANARPVGVRRRRRSAAVLAGLLTALVSAGSVAAAPPQSEPAEPAAEAEAAEPAAAEAEAEPAAKPTAKPSPAKATETPAESGRGTEVFGERLDALDAEVNTLKDRVFRSKARLAVLRETVLAAAMAGARVVVAHRNLMGTGFELIKVTYFLDGAPIFDRRDETGGLDQADEIVIFDGNLAPGRHRVGVELVYRGRGYGAFAYLRGYEFTSRATSEVDVGQRGAMKVVSVGFERGNLTTEMAARPSVDWQVQGLDASGKPIANAAPAASVQGRSERKRR